MPSLFTLMPLLFITIYTNPTFTQNPQLESPVAAKKGGEKFQIGFLRDFFFARISDLLGERLDFEDGFEPESSGGVLEVTYDRQGHLGRGQGRAGLQAGGDL